MTRLALVLCFFISSALCADFVISSMSDFDTFKSSPNSYTNVYLKTDLDFLGVSKYTPINGFTGTFDGLGHTIKNLAIGSDEQYVGLFGELERATIKNLIIDSTCSMHCAYSLGDITTVSAVGSVVGKCVMCKIKNVINFAEISFANSGFVGKAYVGGIAGEFDSDSLCATMTNTANYGTVTNNLIVTNSEIKVAVGGLVGYSMGLSQTVGARLEYIDCVNYGEVVIKNTVVINTCVGGIIGLVTAYPYLTRVISAGIITCDDKIQKGAFIGFGIITGKTTFEYCFTPSEITFRQLFGTGSSYSIDSNDAFGLTENFFKILNTNNAWVNNPNKSDITFQVNDYIPITLSSKTIMLPAIDSTLYTFKGWFTDDSCQNAIDSTNDFFPEDTTLHGGWKYSLKFKFTGGELNGHKDEYIRDVIYKHKIGTFPIPTKNGYTFDAWYDFEGEYASVVPENTILENTGDISVYARWNVKYYNVTFDFANGEDNYNTSYAFGHVVVLPNTPERYEHTFVKWQSNDGKEYDGINTKMPEYDFVITAVWKKNQYLVKFVYFEGNSTEKLFDFNSTINYPSSDVMFREGYSFVNWDNDTERVPNGGIVINAIWQGNYYKLTYVFDNGTDPYTIDVRCGDHISYLSNVVKEGCEFVDWEPNNIFEMPSKNVVIKAKWSYNTYTAGVDLGNGTIYEMRVVYNNTIPYPETLYKEGHTFNGWDGFPVKMPAYNFVMSAEWTINKYIMKFVFNNNKEVDFVEKEFEFNTSVTYPDDPERDGYIFAGWDKNYERMPGRNAVVRSQWIEVTKYVKMTFNSGNLTEKDIIAAVSDYTTDTVKVVESMVDNGKIVATVEFTDNSCSKSFYEKFGDSSDVGLIESIGFIFEWEISLAPFNFVFSFFSLIFIL